jgi:enoyl-CoA hydratase/carnithine racemase
VARWHGLALGGGLELAQACDVLIATPRASFAFPETGIGIYPGLGGTQRPTRRIGVGLTRWLVFTGQTLSADEAAAIGFIDKVVPHDELDAACARRSRGHADGRGGAGAKHRSKPSSPRTTPSLRLGRADTGGDEDGEGDDGSASSAHRPAFRATDRADRRRPSQGLEMELAHGRDLHHEGRVRGTVRSARSPVPGTLIARPPGGFAAQRSTPSG